MLNIPLFETGIPLTSLMIEALVTVCEKECINEPFGEVDLIGSFAGLLRRGFIEPETIHVCGERMISWHVTKSGKITLKRLGFNYEC